MSEIDDGHGPQYGCNYRKCGNPTAELPCPFTADEPAPSPVDGIDVLRTKAELLDELADVLRRILNK